jgi:hypothetical protein
LGPENAARLGVRVPLTTLHRRLGVFGISRDTVNPFSEEDICFLRLVGRVVAFALDDGLNLSRAQSAHACLQSQNERLQLLLNLTNRITSNLQLRELLRAAGGTCRQEWVLSEEPSLHRLHAGTLLHERGGINLPQYARLHSLAVSDSHSDMRSDGSGFHIAHPGAFVAGPQL